SDLPENGANNRQKRANAGESIAQTILRRGNYRCVLQLSSSPPVQIPNDQHDHAGNCGPINGDRLGNRLHASMSQSLNPRENNVAGNPNHDDPRYQGENSLITEAGESDPLFSTVRIADGRGQF